MVASKTKPKHLDENSEFGRIAVAAFKYLVPNTEWHAAYVQGDGHVKFVIKDDDNTEWGINPIYMIKENLRSPWAERPRPDGRKASSMTDDLVKPNRVPGMLGAADRWQKVSAKAVVSGSEAQAINVLNDARHDISCLWSACEHAARRIEQLEADKAELVDELQRYVCDPKVDPACERCKDERRRDCGEFAAALVAKHGSGK